jgi:hypothetical protein
MENKKYKVKLNSHEKVEELLQEVYDQACKQLNEIQNEINKLINSTNLASDDFTMEDKAKYFKAIHDLMGDKKNAIQSKLDIVKFMGEMIKHAGDGNAVLNDKGFQKKTSLDFKSIRDAIKGEEESKTYNLKNK